MATPVQRRGGTAAQHVNFVGLPRELTIDTTNHDIRVHDGATPGGHSIMNRSRIWDLISRTKVPAGTGAIVFADLTGYARLKLSGFIRPSDANAIPALQAMNGSVVDSGASRYRIAGFASVAPAGGAGQPGAGVNPSYPAAENSMRLAAGGMSNLKAHSLNFVADFVLWDDPADFLVNIAGTYLDVPANTITFVNQGAYVGGAPHNGLRIACNAGTMTADLLLEGLRT